jgi:hypothetical protein
MKNTVHNDATSSNLKGKPMTKTIGLHWLHQVTKHVPATDEASVHRALMDRQAPRGMTKGGRRVGEGETERRQGMKNRRMREA